MPLEALRYDVTPTGLHYQVLHFDIPEVDPATWRLAIGGLVERPLELTLDDIRRRPSVTLPVTMECAGNGRGRFEPRPLSLPWLHEAIGTAEWTGTPLWPLIEEAGPTADALELVFRGADRGFQNQDEHDYGAVAVTRRRAATRGDARLRDERRAAPAAARLPAAAARPGLVRDDQRQVAARASRPISEPFDGYQQADRLPLQARRRRPRRARHAAARPGAR